MAEATKATPPNTTKGAASTTAVPEGMMLVKVEELVELKAKAAQHEGLCKKVASLEKDIGELQKKVESAYKDGNDARKDF